MQYGMQYLTYLLQQLAVLLKAGVQGAGAPLLPAPPQRRLCRWRGEQRADVQRLVLGLQKEGRPGRQDQQHYSLETRYKL